MTLKITPYRIILLGFALGIAGCSSVPLVPTENRNKAPSVPPEQTPQDQAIVTPVPDGIAIIPPQAPLEQNITDAKPNTAIVPVSPSVIKPASQSTAVIALLDSAKQFSQHGNLRSAQTSLQRAQRIAPRDPDVYYALANTHLDLQDYGLAEQVALKGVSIVQGQPNQLRRFWTLIATIRTAAGNTRGAKQARDTANRY